MQECIELAREHVKHGSRILILVMTKYEKVGSIFYPNLVQQLEAQDKFQPQLSWRSFQLKAYSSREQT